MSSLRFVGRAQELERLDAAFKSVAAADGGHAVLIGGEAGVGKTRLAAELAARVRAADGLVLVGACLDLTNPAAPFGPLVQALRELRRALDPATWAAVVGDADDVMTRLIPEIGGAGGVDSAETAVLYARMLGLLERLGDRVPTLLVFEDLHWADPSTRDLLVFLARNLRDTRVLLVGTFRSDDLHRRHPLRRVLVELERSGAVARVDLAPFDREELREMITSILGQAPSEALVDATFTRSDGNAFFAEELVAFREDGSRLPETLRDIVLARVDAMSPAARRSLRVIAVAGAGADDRLVAALSGLGVAEHDAGLREATERHVIVTEPGGIAYSFRHALTREAVYDDMLPGERVTLHAAVAEQLSAHPDWCDGGPAQLAGQLAAHWYAAHDAPKAIVAALAAGHEAERMYAYADALAHVETALELWPRIPDAAGVCGTRGINVLHWAAALAHLAGSTDRAVDFIAGALEEAEAGDDPTTLALLHERWARCLRELGAPPGQILEHVDAAVALADNTAPAARARVLATRGQQLMLSGLCADAIAPCEEAIELAQQVGDIAVVSHARNSLAMSLGNLGDNDRCLAGLRRARREAIDAHSWADLARADGNAASVLASAARHREALGVLVHGVDDARVHGLARGTCMRQSICEALWMLGRWDEIDGRLREIDATQPRGIDAWFAAQLWVELSAGHGDFDAARTHLERFDALLGSGFDGRWQLVRTHLHVQLALWEDNLPAALDAAREFASWRYEGTICPDTHPSTDLMLNAMAAASKHYVRARELDLRVEQEQARTVAEYFADVFADWRAGQRWGLGRPGDIAAVARQIKAELAIVEDRVAPEEWGALANDWLAFEMTPRAAYARWRAAELWVAAGDRTEATTAARAAHELAVAIGWHWVRHGVADLARRARLDISDDDASTHDAATALGLTARETDVLRLVAAGRTNRQIAQTLFISTKTASAHVSSLLAKLGVANRAEAGAAARRLGLD